MCVTPLQALLAAGQAKCTHAAGFGWMPPAVWASELGEGGVVPALPRRGPSSWEHPSHQVCIATEGQVSESSTFRCKEKRQTLGEVVLPLGPRAPSLMSALYISSSSSTRDGTSPQDPSHLLYVYLCPQPLPSPPCASAEGEFYLAFFSRWTRRRGEILWLWTSRRSEGSWGSASG